MASISAVTSYGASVTSSSLWAKPSGNGRSAAVLGDQLDLGREPVSTGQSMGIVYERAMDQLRAVVEEARAALGLPEGSALDTSPEATAGRIADFALGAYNAWRERHAELDEEDARKTFANFIGGAIQQGIQEARDILQALSALNAEVDENINSTWNVIQKRLEDFMAGN